MVRCTRSERAKPSCRSKCWCMTGNWCMCWFRGWLAGMQPLGFRNCGRPGSNWPPWLDHNWPGGQLSRPLSPQHRTCHANSLCLHLLGGQCLRGKLDGGCCQTGAKFAVSCNATAQSCDWIITQPPPARCSQSAVWLLSKLQALTCSLRVQV